MQHWFKDMRFSTKVKDGEGMPAFALVNKATGLAVKHSLGQSHPVILYFYFAASFVCAAMEDRRTLTSMSWTHGG